MDFILETYSNLFQIKCRYIEIHIEIRVFERINIIIGDLN